MNVLAQEQQTQLFDEMGAFFAFGQNQFDEQRVEGVEYCTVLNAGDCVPVENAPQFAKRLSAIHREARERELNEKGIDKIIEEELVNHECFYTGDVAPAVEALAYYKVTTEQVSKIYSKVFHKYEDW